MRCFSLGYSESFELSEFEGTDMSKIGTCFCKAQKMESHGSMVNRQIPQFFYLCSPLEIDFIYRVITSFAKENRNSGLIGAWGNPRVTCLQLAITCIELNLNKSLMVCEGMAY